MIAIVTKRKRSSHKNDAPNMDKACVTWPDIFPNVRLRDKTFAVNHCIFVYFPLLLRLKSMISSKVRIG